jgi:hypothetical protein
VYKKNFLILTIFKNLSKNFRWLAGGVENFPNWKPFFEKKLMWLYPMSKHRPLTKRTPKPYDKILNMSS